VLHSAHGRRDETSMQIDEPIAPHEQLTGGATRLQGASDVNKTTLIIVDLVREASAQGFASGIDLLLCVTQSLEQFTANRAFVSINSPPKIDNVRHDQFGSGAWSRCAQVSREITNSEIDFVSDRGDDRHGEIGNGAGDNFLVEFEQIFNPAATPCDTQTVEGPPRFVLL